MKIQIGKRKNRILKALKNMNKYRIFSFLSIFLLIGVTLVLFSVNKIAYPVQKVRSGLINTVSDSSANDYSAYPNVQKFEVPNAKATVVYLPQIHKDPVTQANDPKNDQAAGVQKQIYDNLDKLTKNNNINLVMDETDLYGPMPADKVTNMQNGFSNIDDFKKANDALIKDYLADGGTQQVADQMQKSADAAVAKYERNLDLTGGAAVLAAKDTNVKVYGSQNQATIDEAKKELENLVYLEQRIKQLQGGTSSAGVNGTLSTDQIQSILSKTGGSSSGNSGQIYNSAGQLANTKQDQKLTSDVANTKDKLSKLNTSQNFETMQKFSDVPHTSNPYATSTNLADLKNQYDVAYAKFLKIAKDQRSQEVADNIDKMMTENHQNRAALVFGAQHQDQIVKDLNDKGISVIVVTVPATKDYQAQNPSS